MKRLALWLFPMAVCAGQARYARVGDFDGIVQVQLQAADEWQAARRNLPLRELSRLRTESASRVEVELDDGSVLRLGPDSLAELSDYTRLSTGQRITLVSLDHGLAYFTGAAEGKDALVAAVPGAQVTIGQGARLRLEARDPWSVIAAADGVARFSSPTAEFDLAAGQMVKLDPAHPARFFLNREIVPLETDRWCDERDKVLFSTTSAAQAHPGT
jgi:ferric-dicitrate binding protein FerR (iron transport regulator)